MQGHYVPGTIYVGDQGFQNIRTGTHRFATSRHLTLQFTIGKPKGTVSSDWIGLKVLSMESPWYECTFIAKYLKKNYFNNV